MKIEISEAKPMYLIECWPGQYDIFSHLEFVSGVPSVLFLITTLKENGKPNVCLHAWSTFSGDSGGFYAIMSGLMQSTHTYKNILRDKQFCINFLTSDYYDNCIKTIGENGDDTDEIYAGGFTAEPAKLVKPPRIHEAFLTYECTLESCFDLSGKGINAMIIGKVRQAAIAENYNGMDAILGKSNFMFNIHSPKNPMTGEGERSALAKLQPIKIINE